MITPPTAPAPGKPISASFFSRLISWVKSGQLIDGAGYRTRRTPNGTALELIGAKSKTHHEENNVPWSVGKYVDENDGQVKYRFVNKILQIGYAVFNYDKPAFSDFVTQPDDLEHDNYYLEINLSKYPLEEDVPSIEIKAGETDEDVDWENKIVRINLGFFNSDNKLLYGIKVVPVIYMYI